MVITDSFKKRFLIIFLWILFVLTAIVLVLSVNKGFDFTDEGYFLLDYKYVNIYRGGIHNYHLIVTAVTNWLNPSILYYRWMSHVLMLTCSIILSFGFFKWMKVVYKKQSEDYINWWIIFGFISLGNFLFYFTGLQLIHNNTLTNFCIQSITGAFLFFLSLSMDERGKSKKGIALLCFMGFLCGIGFFVKFTTFSGLALFCLAVLFFRLRARWFIVVSFSSGVYAGVATYFFWIQGFFEWFFNFKDAYFMLSDHSPIKLLKEYLVSIYSLIKFCLLYFSWLGLFPLLIVTSRYFYSFFNQRWVTTSLKVCTLIGMLLFASEIVYFQFYRSPFATGRAINAYFYIAIILFQLSLLFAFRWTSPQVKINSFYDKLLVIGFLLPLPLLGAFGTANPLFLNALIHMAPWCCIMMILTIELTSYSSSFVMPLIFILLPAMVTTSQIIDGNIYSPYYSSVMNSNHANFFYQNEEVTELPFMSGIQVDVKTKKFLIELNALLKRNGFKKGDPIFGYNIPGVVYAMEGISPGMPHYFKLLPRDCIAMNRFKMTNNPPIIMLGAHEKIDEELLICMKEKGIDPDDYIFKGEVYFPNTGAMLKVYFPN